MAEMILQHHEQDRMWQIYRYLMGDDPRSRQERETLAKQLEAMLANAVVEDEEAEFARRQAELDRVVRDIAKNIHITIKAGRLSEQDCTVLAREIVAFLLKWMGH